MPERGALGVWLVGEAGAVLVAPGGRRVFCWCVQVPEPGLPSGDRIAHLLLALRTDEEGFATVANLAFSGAPWRLRRRLPPRARPALDAGVRLSRRSSPRVVNIGSTVHGADGLIGPMMLTMTHLDRPPPRPRARGQPPPATGPLSPGVRRFRLAQLRLEGRDVPRSERFAHLKRSYD